MHNLAVLYAEGIDGKPDYQNAAKWFRKAAAYGLTDSQYNLGVLYGRGIGMEPNLAEAYKWFTLAARDGDKEALAKRDDVGARLDPQSAGSRKARGAGLDSPSRQPEAATQAAIPAGGWGIVAAPPPGSPKPRNPPGPRPTARSRSRALKHTTISAGIASLVPAISGRPASAAAHVPGFFLKMRPIELPQLRTEPVSTFSGNALSLDPNARPHPSTRFLPFRDRSNRRTIPVQIYLPIADLPVNIFLILEWGLRSASSPACSYRRRISDDAAVDLPRRLAGGGGGDRLQPYRGVLMLRGESAIGGGGRSMCRSPVCCSAAAFAAPASGVWLFTTLRERSASSISQSVSPTCCCSASSAA